MLMFRMFWWQCQSLSKLLKISTADHNKTQGDLAAAQDNIAQLKVSWHVAYVCAVQIVTIISKVYVL